MSVVLSVLLGCSTVQPSLICRILLDKIMIASQDAFSHLFHTWNLSLGSQRTFGCSIFGRWPLKKNAFQEPPKRALVVHCWGSQSLPSVSWIQRRPSLSYQVIQQGFGTWSCWLFGTYIVIAFYYYLKSHNYGTANYALFSKHPHHGIIVGVLATVQVMRFFMKTNKTLTKVDPPKMYTTCLHIIHPPGQTQRTRCPAQVQSLCPQKALNKFGPATACQNRWYHLLMAAPWLQQGKHRWRGWARPRGVVMKTKRGEQKVSNLRGNEHVPSWEGRSFISPSPWDAMPRKRKTKGENEMNIASSVPTSTCTSPPPPPPPPPCGEKDDQKSHGKWRGGTGFVGISYILYTVKYIYIILTLQIA